MARTPAPQADPGQQQDAGQGQDPEAGRITTIEDIAARQHATDGKVDTLMGKVDQLLGGSQHREPAGPGQATGQPAGQPADHLDEIKRAIRDVRAEDQAADQQAAHDAEHARLRDGQKPPEQQPREAAVRGKQRLQKILFGADK